MIIFVPANCGGSNSKSKTTHGMICRCTACLGPLWLTLEAAAEVVEAEAFPVSFSSGWEGRS